MKQELVACSSQQAQFFTELGYLWSTDTINHGGEQSQRFAIQHHWGLDLSWSRMALYLS